jgi:hypothetical protein
LGTDKRNPCLEVYRDESEDYLHVYYGFELLEVVPNDRESMSFKLLAAQLYNAGLKVKALEETLLVNHKTMARWGDAVCSGDPEKLVQVLLGRQSRRSSVLGLKPMSGSIGRRFKLEGATTVGEPGRR